MPTELSLAVPNVWRYVREVRDQVLLALQGLPKEVTEAAEMTVAELMENAIKYGDDVRTCTEVRIGVRMDEDRLTVEISNGVKDLASLKRVKDRIDEINGGTSHEALYLNRLRHLLDHPEESGSLGLYRIAFEGRFDLAYQYRDEVLTITATRTLEPSEP